MRRQREEQETELCTVNKRRFIDNGKGAYNSIDPYSFELLKSDFLKDPNNRLIQNALSANPLHELCKNRQFMQSRNDHFSHELNFEPTRTDQGSTGRCWAFAAFNIMRHEIIQKLQLPLDFEFSESYLSFYEKIEKCNNILTYFLDKDDIDTNNRTVCELLERCAVDGGHWITCANLIKKYGIIPKDCFKESSHSYATHELNQRLGYKIREYVYKLVSQKNMDKRLELKNKMMAEIYSLLVKMFGCPPGVDEKVEWSFSLRKDLHQQLAREILMKFKKGVELDNMKKSVEISPREFYSKLIVNDFNDYCLFSHDPRNPFNKYYQSFNDDFVIGGEKNGYYNIDMNEIIKMCVKSIKGDTPVQFDCDIDKYLNYDENVLDTRSFDYESIFGVSFNSLTKKQRMELFDSYANHAMILVGINEEKICEDDCNSKTIPLGKCNCKGKKRVTKFKIENSWGRDDGYYTAGLDWFENYVYNIVVHKKYVSKKLFKKYKREKSNPVVLPEHDIMA
jgi:bleomycin hydrolase